MGIRLRVIGGPEKGRSFLFTEADCFIVGRGAPGSRAHFRLGPGDPSVSRNHFMLEVRPSCCYLRDNRSRNGTFVRAAGDDRFREVQAARLLPGDQIRVGRTVLEIFLEEDTGTVGGPANAAVVQREPAQAAAAVLPPRESGDPGRRFSCMGCGADVSHAADRDGRASDLAGSARYLCGRCAAAGQRGADLGEIGDYLVLEELGRGAMGAVYRAWHGPTGRVVALKRILPGSAMDQRALCLFRREIAVMSAVRHPNIVRLFDHGVYEGDPFLVCEFVDGGSIDVLPARATGAAAAPRACAIAVQVLRALEYAHGQGYVHRDVKPKNILVEDRAGGGDTVKLTDFGLAKSFQAAGQSGITRPRETSGTLFFMAPEQFTNYRFVKPPADTYSVGVTLYYLLTARYPYCFPTPLEQIQGLVQNRRPRDPVRTILEDRPIPIRDQNQEIPKPLADVVDKAVRKNERRRFQTAQEFRRALEEAARRPARGSGIE